MYIGYQVLLGWKEGGHKTLQILTVQQIFLERKRKHPLTHLFIISFICAMGTRALICDHWAYNSVQVREPYIRENTSQACACNIGLKSYANLVLLHCQLASGMFWVVKHRVSGQSTVISPAWAAPEEIVYNRDKNRCW